MRFPVFSKAHAGVALIRGCLEKLAWYAHRMASPQDIAGNSLDPAKIGNLVGTFKPYNGKPLFVTEVIFAGHVDETFCLTVDGTHTFYVYSGNSQYLIAANCDDGHNIKQGESKKIREGTVEWFRTSMLNRLNDMAKSCIIVIMQRVHEMDISGCILSDPESFNFTHLCIPNEIEKKPKPTSIGWKDPRTKKNQLFWPERLNAEQTAKLKKKMGIFAYAGQYQQRPSPAAGMIIDPASWKVWDEEYWPPFDFVVAGLDSAYTEKEENDPSGFTVWGVFRDEKTRQPMVMLMYSFSERLEMHDLVTRVADLCARMHVDKLLIEAKASGISVYQEMRRLFSRTVSCQLITPRGDKVQRAHAVAYLFDDGLVGYPKGKEYAVKVVDELAKLPKGENDDLCDSSTMVLNYMRNCGWLLTTEEGTGEVEMHRYGKVLQDESEPLYDV